MADKKAHMSCCLPIPLFITYIVIIIFAIISFNEYDLPSIQISVIISAA